MEWYHAVFKHSFSVLVFTNSSFLLFCCFQKKSDVEECFSVIGKFDFLCVGRTKVRFGNDCLNNNKLVFRLGYQ